MHKVRLFVSHTVSIDGYHPNIHVRHGSVGDALSGWADDFAGEEAGVGDMTFIKMSFASRWMFICLAAAVATILKGTISSIG